MIKIKEDKRLLSFSFNDCLTYHGGVMPCGVSVAYKMFVYLGQELDYIPERKEMSIYCGAGPSGKGVVDTIELITRANSSGQLDTNPTYSLDKPGVKGPVEGRFYYEIKLADKKVYKFALKKGALCDEFLDYAGYIWRKRAVGEFVSLAEASKLLHLRKDASQKLLKMQYHDVFDLV